VDSQVDARTSATQIRYAAERLAASGVDGRVRLCQRNARDIGRLLDQDPPYDLVIFRSSIAHFTPETLESAMAAVSAHTRDDATVLISDPLYDIPTGNYESPTADETDRLACGNRKTLVAVLERHSFSIADIRELPSNADSIGWLAAVKANIEEHLPTDRPQALQEMADVADNLAAGMRAGMTSVDSVVPVANIIVVPRDDAVRYSRGRGQLHGFREGMAVNRMICRPLWTKRRPAGGAA
jgi:hypothetical protein